MVKVLYVHRGQTIVEAIVVIAVVVLLVTGLIAGTTTSLRSAQAGRSKNQALKYAEEALEYSRSMRDRSWDSFQALSGAYCMSNTTPLLLVYSATDTCTTNISTGEGSYSRKVTYAWDGTKMIVTVSVSYPDGATTKEVTLTTYYTQWK